MADGTAHPRPADLDLSPSRAHRRLIDQLEPRLTYDGGDVAAWQGKARRKLRRLLGVPRNPHGPLYERTLWQRDHELGTIEKIAFQAEPGADVVGYWCVPSGLEAPYPTFICLQGHSTGMHNSIGLDADEQTPKEIPGDRDFALGCLRRGIAALCIEQRAFGQRGEWDLPQEAKSTYCHDASMHALMLGRTLLGERVLDVDRAIDWLAQRGQADMSRLGCMGNSGGGTVTLYASALLGRLQLAMPSCALATYADSIGKIIHCWCNYVPDILHWMDMGDVLGCFAPRPVVVVAGKNDDIFPLPSVRAAFRQAKAIYNAAGAGQYLHLVIGEGGHRFYADQGWRMMKRHL